MIKRIAAALMAAMMCISAAACGSSKETQDGTSDKQESTAVDSEKDNEEEDEAAEDSEMDGEEEDEVPEDAGTDDDDSQLAYIFKEEDSDAVLGESDKITDPQAIYDSLTYNEKMLYGSYTISADHYSSPSDEELEGFLEGMEFENRVVDEYGQRSVSKLPVAYDAGSDNVMGMIAKVQGYEWMELYFVDEDGNPVQEYAAYTVSGNTITMRYVMEQDYYIHSNHLAYKLSDTTVEYTFHFDGLYLTLTRDDLSVTLHPSEFEKSEYSLYVNALPESGSATFGRVKHLNIMESYNEGSGRNYAYAITTGDVQNDAAAELRADGLFTITWAAGTYQFVAFYVGSGGIILADEDNVYYYTADQYDFYENELSSSLMMDDIDALDTLTDTQLQEIVEKRDNLFDELAAAFEEAGLDVVVDPDSGEIAIDDAVLFPVDEYAVSDEGKSFLNTFLEIYTSVVFSEEYDGFVSKIVVEGHTDSSGTYEYNQELSENRAQSVLDYCISDGTGLDADAVSSLEALLAAVGYSYERPIYDENGNEDMDASRRVSFRFMISLG